jgi:hypothetical protein
VTELWYHLNGLRHGDGSLLDNGFGIVISHIIYL